LGKHYRPASQDILSGLIGAELPGHDLFSSSEGLMRVFVAYLLAT
jgi:hypothetical protein